MEKKLTNKKKLQNEDIKINPALTYIQKTESGDDKYLLPEYKNKEKIENKILDMEDCKEMLTEKGFLYSGHGTSGDRDVIESIFKQGLKTDKSSLYYTSNNISTGGEESWSRFKNSVDNWQHENAKNVIILKLPIEYLNIDGDEAYEKYNAFYNQKAVGSNIKNFVDSKFIVGCYNANTKKFEMNPNFESQFTNETKVELKKKLEIAKNLTKERLLRQEFEPMFNSNIEENVNNDRSLNLNPITDFSEFSEEDFNNTSW